MKDLRDVQGQDVHEQGIFKPYRGASLMQNTHLPRTTIGP